MPLFEYRCKDCGERFETLVFSSSGDEGVECPKCHGTQTEKQISMFASSGARDAGGASASSCSSSGGYFT